VSNLDNAFSLGTFETGAFGARFKICFDRARPAPPACFAVGAHTEHELYVAPATNGSPTTDGSSGHRITTPDSWPTTMKRLRWLRSQSPATIRAWLRDNGFEPFIDEEMGKARTAPTM
jgi:hypothetical protein